jgi:hypothetical protein
MLDFARFPWFRAATIADVCEVTVEHGYHLRWPRLDVDLHLESLEHPERFPLVSKVSAKRPTAKRTPRRATPRSAT